MGSPIYNAIECVFEVAECCCAQPPLERAREALDSEARSYRQRKELTPVSEEALVQEAIRLFESEFKQQPADGASNYEEGCSESSRTTQKERFFHRCCSKAVMLLRTRLKELPQRQPEKKAQSPLLSEYERKRKTNIADNATMLRALGLGS